MNQAVEEIKEGVGNKTARYHLIEPGAINIDSDNDDNDDIAKMLVEQVRITTEMRPGDVIVYALNQDDETLSFVGYDEIIPCRDEIDDPEYKFIPPVFPIISQYPIGYWSTIEINGPLFAHPRLPIDAEQLRLNFIPNDMRVFPHTAELGYVTFVYRDEHFAVIYKHGVNVDQLNTMTYVVWVPDMEITTDDSHETYNGATITYDVITYLQKQHNITPNTTLFYMYCDTDEY